MSADLLAADLWLLAICCWLLVTENQKSKTKTENSKRKTL
jgi:hypothetical protein